MFWLCQQPLMGHDNDWGDSGAHSLRQSLHCSVMLSHHHNSMKVTVTSRLYCTGHGNKQSLRDEIRKSHWHQQRVTFTSSPVSQSHISMSFSNSTACTDMASCLLSISPHQAHPMCRPPPPVRNWGPRRAPCQIHQIVSSTAANRRPAQVTMESTH